MGLSQRAQALCSTYEAEDLEGFLALLDEHVFWGDPAFPDSPDACHSREEVLVWYRRLRAQGVRASVVDVIESEQCVALGLSVTGPERGPRRGDAVRYQVFQFEGALVTQIWGTDDRALAVAMVGGATGG